jgi:hypothetical protein
MIKSKHTECATTTDKPKREAEGKSKPARERRSAHRTADDQRSGEGALSALSRLQMIERQRAQAQATDWRKERDE